MTFRNLTTHRLGISSGAQGALHYLLGNRHLADGPFTVPADGVEREIFTDYGVMYEAVRKQKGYALA